MARGWQRCLSGWLKLCGMVLTVSGAVIITYVNFTPQHSSAPTTTAAPVTRNTARGSAAESASQDLDLTFGYSLLFAQVVMGALYGIFQKPLLAHYSSIVVCAWGYAMGTLEIAITFVVSAAVAHVFPVSLKEIPDVTSKAFWQVPRSSLLPLLYAVLIMSALGYWIMSWVNQRASPFFVTMFYPVSGVATALLAWIFLRESVKPGICIGAVLIATGLYCVLVARSRESTDLEEDKLSSDVKGYDLDDESGGDGGSLDGDDGSSS